ncbi:MAG TPA: tetratricopeptide repeat protein [Saprospiraceae bacterium]|nr:tetratricopeptide repeat protein [Saprospiraceae bacterium]
MVHQQVFFKAIIQGTLEFGNEKSYHKVQALYLQRMETLYKKEVIFKIPEQLFNEETHTLHIPRFIGNTTEKAWKNTINLLEYCAQFCYSGAINAWLTDNGKILSHYHIEPLGEKSMVVLYQAGKKLAEEKGSEKEAIKLLTEAIEKYERHSQAYEKRGYVNFHLKNYSDAVYDFSKSIKLDAQNSSSHYGLGRCYFIKKKYNEAILSMEEALKFTIALHPLYWAARRFKGQCYIELEQWDNACFEYKLFTSRNYPHTDPNYKHLPLAWYNYGKALFALGKIEDAVESFDKSLSYQLDQTDELKAKMFLQRGMARKAAGLSDYILDFKKASELGLQSATDMLIVNK